MADQDIGRLVAKLVLDVQDFSKGIDSANKSLETITQGNAWKSLEKGTESLAKGMAVAGGTILTTAGVAAKAAIDFEEAFAGVKKTVDFSGTQEEAETFFTSLEEGIREMSTQLPTTAVEIAGVTEAAGQLGIENNRLLEFTETMIGLGSATNITAQDAAVALAQFANVTQMSQTDFDNLGSSIVALGNNMATDEASIVNMATELANLAQSCGMSEADILGMSASLSSLGLDAAASGTAMQRLTMDITQSVANFSQALTENADMTKEEFDAFVEEVGFSITTFAEIAGMSADEFATAWRQDATGALTAFFEGLGAMGSDEQLAVFDTLEIKQMREIDMLQRVAGNTDLVKSAVDLSNKAWMDNSALSEEVGKRNETTASQLQMVKNMLTDIAVEAGNALLPIIQQLLVQAKPLLETVSNYLNEHPDTVQRVTKVGAALLAIGGTVGAIINVVGAIGSFITAIKTIGTAITVLTGGGAAAGGGILAGLVAGISGILPVIAAVAAAVGVFAIAWHNDWFGIQEKFGAAKEWIVNKFGELKTAFEEGGLQGVIEKIGDDISGWWENSVIPWFDNVKTKIGENFERISDTVKDKMSDISDFIHNTVANIKSVLESIGDAITSAWNKIKDFASSAVSKVSGVFGGGRASGGWVSSGTTYLVGELGPELITPTRSGYVHTAEETEGMLGSHSGGITININGDIYDDEQSMRSKMQTAILDVIETELAYG